MTELRHVNPTISVDSPGIDGTVRITVRTDLLANDSITLDLDPGVALELASDLARHASYSARTAVVAIATGDCGTCRNTRLVDEETSGGRSTRVRCPDCESAYVEACLNPWSRPRLGGGVR